MRRVIVQQGAFGIALIVCIILTVCKPCDVVVKFLQGIAWAYTCVLLPCVV